MSKYGYEEQSFPAEFNDPVYSKQLRDVKFWLDYAQKAGSRTLELACGTGRVLFPLAQAGITITGLDYSVYMLDICRQKLAQQPQDIQRRVRIIQANMANFQTGEQYSLVIIPGRSFQILITPAEQESCLHSIAAHLKSHGTLIIDVFHPDFPRLYDPKYLQEFDRTSGVKLADGRTVDVTSRIAAYHKDMQYNEVEEIYYVHHKDGREERLVQSFPFHYFFRYEMEHLLRLCGFKVIDLFGNFDKSPFTNESPEMIFVAEKA
jgi:SAM-dependent methyltransferase